MSAHDPVNSPSHYTSSKAKCPACDLTIEAIQITRHMNFNLGNATKYIWRAALKNGVEDLKKAIWYLTDEVKRQEGK